MQPHMGRFMDSRTTRTIAHLAYVWLIATDILDHVLHPTVCRLLNHSNSIMRLKP